MASTKPLIVVTLPGLRRDDLPRLPALNQLCAAGTIHELVVPFPAVTWPAQATLLTGHYPEEHGVIANGFFWRDSNSLEMWTAGNEVIQQPQVWDWLHRSNPVRTSAAWFPMLSKRCGADYVCMPAPVHNPDGSETMWCYTKPTELYGSLLDSLGGFPLQHFWGPLANIRSSQWIADSAVALATQHRPDFFYVYLPHLDYAAQKFGPNSTAAMSALDELNTLVDGFVQRISAAYDRDLTWLIVSEYAIHETSHVSFPNRILREAGLLAVREAADGEHLDFEKSQAWALVDHQFSHIFARDSSTTTIRRIAELFDGQRGIRDVVHGKELATWKMGHARSGELILVSEPQSWQAYYWWLDDSKAPAFARTVDIHRKPGYDPIELHFDMATRSIPIDARLNKGSHGAPPDWHGRQEVLLSSEPGLFRTDHVRLTDVFPALLRHFGIAPPSRFAESP